MKIKRSTLRKLIKEEMKQLNEYMFKKIKAEVTISGDYKEITQATRILNDWMLNEFQQILDRNGLTVFIDNVDTKIRKVR